MYILAGYNTLAPRYNELCETHPLGNLISQKFSRIIDGHLQTFALDANAINKINTLEDATAYTDKVSKFIESLHTDAKDFKNRFYVDSGGYQISIDLVDESKYKNMIDAYKIFLEKNEMLYDRAFSLDFIPATLKTLTVDDLIRFNRMGLVEDMPQLSDKIVKIFHFITPGCVNMYEQIFFQNDNARTGREYWSVGGLVAFDRTEGKLFTFPYILAFSHIYNLYNKKYGSLGKPTYIEFHLLGVSSHNDVIVAKFLEKAAQLLLGIKVVVTHDSSRLFKAIVRGKEITYFDIKNLSLVNISYKSNELDTINPKLRMTNREALQLTCKEICGTNLDFSKVYEDEKDPTSKPLTNMEMLIMLADTAQFRKLKLVLNKLLDPIDDYERLVSVSSEIFASVTSSRSYKYFLNKMGYVKDLLEKDPQETRYLLQSMFEGVNRLTYLKTQ